MAWLMAEIGKRCGTNAFEIAAIGRQAEIKRENLVLSQHAFELDGAHHLPELGADGTVRPGLQQSRNLHSERGGAGDNMEVGYELKDRPPERIRIDAVV